MYIYIYIYIYTHTRGNISSRRFVTNLEQEREHASKRVKKKKRLEKRRIISSLSYGSYYQILRRANSPLRGRLLDHSAQRDTRGSDQSSPPSSTFFFEHLQARNSKFRSKDMGIGQNRMKINFFQGLEFFFFSFEK